MTLNDFCRIYIPPFLEILKKEIGSVTVLTCLFSCLGKMLMDEFFYKLSELLSKGKGNMRLRMWTCSQKKLLCALWPGSKIKRQFGYSRFCNLEGLRKHQYCVIHSFIC